MYENNTIVTPVAVDPQYKWAEPFAPDSPERYGGYYVSAEFNLDKLCESIWRQVETLWRIGAKPTDILLGRDFYGRFMAQASAHYFNFKIPPDYRARMFPQGFATTFASCTVHCIPWMEGVVVTPALTSVPHKPYATNEWGVNTDSESVILPAKEIPKTAADPGLIRQVLSGLQESFVAWLNKQNEDMTGFVRPDKRRNGRNR